MTGAPATTGKRRRWLIAFGLAALALALTAGRSALAARCPLDDLSARSADAGPEGMLTLGLGYVALSLTLIPGVGLTVLFGGLFGFWRGVALASVSSTTAALLAFAISRHVARDRLARFAARRPRFQAFDRAIARGGWRVVALFRLSPALPFSLGNYLFGLTAIPFVPYAITTWLFMLPGTLFYVSLGAAGHAALHGGLSPVQWAWQILGVAATLAVTLYLGALARRALVAVEPRAFSEDSEP